MYQIRKTKDFEKSYKNIKRSGKLNNTIQKDLNTIIDLLIENKTLPAKFKDHQLKGKLKDYRECHLKADLLLIYKIIENELILVLVDIGSHSYVFK